MVTINKTIQMNPKDMSTNELLQEIESIQQSLKDNPTIPYNDIDNRYYRLINLIKEYNLK